MSFPPPFLRRRLGAALFGAAAVCVHGQASAAPAVAVENADPGPSSVSPILSSSSVGQATTSKATTDKTTTAKTTETLGAGAQGKDDSTKKQPEAPGEERATIIADDMTHDKTLDIVTARGKVEVEYGGRILLADTVSYQRSKDRATASGNVILTDIDGTTSFSDYAELTGDLKEGFARELRILLTDGSLAAAREGRRTGGTRTEMDNAVYTACDACSNKPNASRLWQIRASKVVHDEQDKEIRYRHAWLEMFGLPVAYTPYLSHPDPTVKRRSGILPPIMGSSNALGYTFGVPYYIVIDDQQDATITPIYHSDENPSLRGEYRGIGHSASLDISGSITKDKKDNIRNHVIAYPKLSIDDTWRAGADIALASDPTYIKRYRLGSQTYLTNHPYLEGFARRSYSVLQGYYFQAMSSAAREEDTPLVAPLAEWNHVSAPNHRGAYHTADVGTAIVMRENGVQSRRLSATYGWHLPHIGSMGDVTKLDVSMRSDLYNASRVPMDDGTLYNGSTGRLFPQAALTWSFPLARTRADWTDVIEPVVQGIVASRGGNPEKIPNEDSLDYEFHDTNLFSTNRFTGWDRVESGSRINYGLKWSAYGTKVGQVKTLFGQSVRSYKDMTFSAASGVRSQVSDYVGSVSYYPGGNLGLNYSFRLDRHTFDTKRSELSLSVGPPILSFSLSHLSLEDAPLTEGGLGKRGEITAGVSSQFSRYWSAGASARYRLQPKKEPVTAGGSLSYNDECFTLSLSAMNDFTYDKDKEAGFTTMFYISFKSLTDFQGSLGLGSSSTSTSK